jgi:hypothetical protein
VLALISRTLRAPGATEVLIDPALESNSGLRYPSVASCRNLLTIDQGLIVQTTGQLSAGTMGRLGAQLAPNGFSRSFRRQ